MELAVQFGESYTEIEFAASVRILAMHKGACAKVYDATHPLSLGWDDLVAAEQALSAAQAQARRQVRAVLASVNTMKRLHEVWPESKPFTAEIFPPEAQLPALPIVDLNTMLRLG